MHGDCEHIIYVKALTDDKEAAALAKVPVMRQRGRKRKTAPVGPEPQEAKKPRRQQKASWLQARHAVINQVLQSSITYRNNKS